MYEIECMPKTCFENKDDLILREIVIWKIKFLNCFPQKKSRGSSAILRLNRKLVKSHTV